MAIREVSMKKKYQFAISIALIGALLDQLTKFVVKNDLGINDSVPIVKNALHITYTTNTGSAFGLFKDLNLLFILISTAIMIFMTHYLKNAKSKNNIVYVFFGMLFGGIIGNLIDRLMLGYVIDFIDFRIWPVFNLADSLITISVIGLVFYSRKKK